MDTMDTTCPSLLPICDLTSDYGSRDTSFVEDYPIDGFYYMHCNLFSGDNSVLLYS